MSEAVRIQPRRSSGERASVHHDQRDNRQKQGTLGKQADRLHRQRARGQGRVLMPVTSDLIGSYRMWRGGPFRKVCV